MKRPFYDDGCELCRSSWLANYSIDEQIGSDFGYPIYRCRVCGTYWAQTQKWVLAISEEKALRRLRGEQDPPTAPLPEYLQLPAHRDWPTKVGRVILPDMPLTEAEGRDAGLRWAAEVLSAIADVLDADPSATSYVLRLLRRAGPSARHGGAVVRRDGYNLLVPGPLDWDVARARLDPALPPDWDRDSGDGPAKAIGMMARYESLRGPSEIETVGSGLAGRRRLRQHRREFADWQASVR